MDDFAKEIGNRADWYFRLNGLFCLPAYIIHKAYMSEKPRTEADIIVFRLIASCRSRAGCA